MHLRYLHLARILPFFFFVLPLFSQVIIKEKIEIKPQLPNAFSKRGGVTSTSATSYYDPPPLIVRDGLPTLTLHSTITVTGEIDQDPNNFAAGWNVMIVLMKGYQEHILRWVGRLPAGHGGTVFSHSAPFSGTWSQGGIDLRMYLFDYAWGNGTRQVASGGESVVFTGTLHSVQTSLPIAGRALISATPLADARFAGWRLHPVDTVLESGKSSRIDVGTMNASGWHYDPLPIPGAEAFATVQVTGGDYVYLQWLEWSGQSTVEGKEITISLVDQGTFRGGTSCWLVFDPSRGNFNGLEEEVVVTIVGGGKSDTTKIKLVRVLDHFEVLSAKDTVVKGTTTQLTVIAKDGGGQEIEIDPAREVVLSLSGGMIIAAASRQQTKQENLASPQVRANIHAADVSAIFGSFVVSGTDTIPDQATVPYGIARAGAVQYLANGDIPTGSEPETITIRAEAADDWTKFGEIQVVVKKSAATIALDIPTPKEIWPTLPQGSGGNPGKRNIKEHITLTATRGGVPAANYEVEISATMVLPSGGHEHTPPPPQALLGELKDIRTGRKGKGTLKTETDTEGKIVLEYTAPEFSGKFEVTAKSTTEQGEDKDELTVKVPELTELGASSYYELVGTPDNHKGTNDPCRDASSLRSLHFQNHYGTVKLLQAIQNIAAAYAQFHPGIRLRINDMSLEYGGLFDINNNWQTPHRGHRIGENADIAFIGINRDNECENLNIRRLERLVRIHTQNEPVMEGNHYHIKMN